MVKTVTEEYAELYHYTTAEGLLGIMKSQCLRATNIAFLNDAEERIGYLNKRMPYVIERSVRSVVNSFWDDPKTRGVIEQSGGKENSIRSLSDQLIAAIKDHLISFDEPYVVSFCATKDVNIARDGLLSQWRGYGVDGGYAIVFDTSGLESLLVEENKKHLYLSVYWGDINYYDKANGDKASLDEVYENETMIDKSIANFIRSPRDENALAEIYGPITMLSCFTKHWGFHEEKEVRIVAVRATSEFASEARELGENRPEKCVHHLSRNGVLVPYVNLFEELTLPTSLKLPIKSIIVGPHPEKLKRKQAIEILLKQCGMSAEVTVSDIPYIPR
jgi:hypothetical protein